MDPENHAKPRGRPRDEQLTLRRTDEILDVAAKVFAERGYGNTDVQVIADRLSLGKGTIYRYFPTKRDLFLAAVDLGMRRLRERADACLSLVDPFDMMCEGIRAYLSFFAEHPEYVELLIQERAEFRDRSTPTYFVHRAENVVRWQELLRQLTAEGRVRPVSPEWMTNVVGDLLYGTMFCNYFAPRPASVDQQAREIFEVIFCGVLTERGQAACARANPLRTACPPPVGTADGEELSVRLKATEHRRPVHRPLLLVLGGAISLAGLILTGCNETRQAKAASTAAATAPTQAASAPAPSAPSNRRLVPVRRETLRRYAPSVGTFRARQITKLGPQVSGRVKEVLVDVGDRVKAGQPLVRLDPTFFKLELAQLEAAVAAAQGTLNAAQADVDLTKREMDRQIELFDRGNGSQKERDDAMTSHTRALSMHVAAAARLEEARRRVDYGRQRLEETEIRAPYDGAVTARYVHPGEPANSTPTTDLVEIQEVGTLHLEFSLPQDLLASVGAGNRVEFEVEGVTGDWPATRIAVVFPAIDESTRSFRCRAVIDNGNGRLYPGLLARVRVASQEAPDALIVPRAALSPTAGGWQALVSTENGPQTRTVEVGLLTEEYAQITQGLTENDQVYAAVAGG